MGCNSDSSTDNADNAGKCDEEFEGQDGVVKTFRSDYLIIDETTGQTGDALWVAVTDVQDS